MLKMTEKSLELLLVMGLFILFGLSRPNTFNTLCVLIQLNSGQMHPYNQQFAHKRGIKSLLQAETFPASDHFLRVVGDSLPQGECLAVPNLWPDKSLFPREPLTKELVAHNSC